MFAAETIQGWKLFSEILCFKFRPIPFISVFAILTPKWLKCPFHDRKTNRDDIGLILKVMGKLHFIQNFDIDKKVSQILKHG